MPSRTRSFASVLLMNLAAVYVPALCWMPALAPRASMAELAGKVTTPWLFALWPVLVIDPSDNTETLTGVVVFLAILASLSFWVRHRRTARIVVLGPLCLASFQLGQAQICWRRAKLLLVRLPTVPLLAPT